jgi:hypothetical protein
VKSSGAFVSRLKLLLLGGNRTDDYEIYLVDGTEYNDDLHSKVTFLMQDYRRFGEAPSQLTVGRSD